MDVRLFSRVRQLSEQDRWASNARICQAAIFFTLLTFLFLYVQIYHLTAKLLCAQHFERKN
jgi:hypothetical protein